MLAVVPVDEAVQFPFFDPSTENAGHSGAEWKYQGVSSLQRGLKSYTRCRSCY